MVAREKSRYVFLGIVFDGDMKYFWCCDGGAGNGSRAVSSRIPEHKETSLFVLISQDKRRPRVPRGSRYLSR